MLSRTLRLMRFWAVLLAIMAAYGVFLAGCGGSGGSGSNDLTPERRTAIEADSQAIFQKLASLGSDLTAAQLEEARQFAATRPNVAKAAVSGDDVIVEYKNAGLEYFLLKQPVPQPPLDFDFFQQESRRVIDRINAMPPSSRAPVGGKEAVLINSLFSDPDFVALKPVYEVTKKVLETAGFHVTTLYDEAVTPEALGKLQYASLIMITGHGGSSELENLQFSYPYAIQTGMLWDNSAPFFDWLTRRVVRVTTPKGKSFFGVTDRFFTERYNRKPMTKALFLNCSCNGAKTRLFADAMKNCGVIGYTGWTESQAMGPFSASRMLFRMVTGDTLRQAVDFLPNDYKVVHNVDKGRDITAELQIQFGADTTLGVRIPVQHSVIIREPSDGSDSANPVLTVKGHIDGWNEALGATIAVNGESSKLSVSADGTFEQEIEIISGPNDIRVSVIEWAEDFRKVLIQGKFDAPTLHTRLRWNTDGNDVDLHLIPIEGSADPTEDCYFSHQEASWGAALDVDDTDGNGPEHITAQTLPPGRYKLFVRYYADHGQTQAPTADVLVGTFGNATRRFRSPQLQNVNDDWVVCEIKFPEGEITEINRYIPADAQRSRRVNPPKPAAQTKRMARR